MAAPIVRTTDIPTAGTRVQINNTSRRILSITLKARNGNTGSVFVGDSTVSSSQGIELRPNESTGFHFGGSRVSSLLSDYWVDTATGGNDVDWIAILWP